MTQEQKDLLLKDLCARLPYGVKVQVAPVPSKEYEHITYNAKIVYIDNNYIGVLSDWNSVFQQDITKVKPYLFPLSSMTVEQRCKVQNLLPNHCDISFKNQKITFYDEGNIQLEQLEKVFNFFNMHHIDYRGLIPMGLANDATGLNIY